MGHSSSTPSLTAFGIVSAVLAVLLFGFSIARVQADSPDLVLEIIPESIELSADEEARFIVVVSNPFGRTANNLELSWFTNSDLQVTGAVSPVTSLPPNAETTWTLVVRQGELGPDSGKVHLRLDYTLPETASSASDSSQSQAEPVPVPRVLFGELQVAIPQPEPVAKLASVEIASTLTALNEQRPGIVYLLLENKGDIPLRVDDISPGGPTFIEFALPQSARKLVLEPLEKRSIPIQVSATDVVQPGKSLLVFQIQLSWEKGRQRQTGTLITSHEVDVGVFGESQILTLLGIPAFFLLPGFLMILAFKMLWSLDKTKEEAALFPLALNSSEFWFVAITLSLLMAMLYPLGTALIFKVRRDYLRAYGLTDVLRLWFGSILLAVSVFVVCYGGGRLLQRMREAQKRKQEKRLSETTPAPDDDPKEIVRKLQRQNLTLCRDKIGIRVNDQVYDAFLLQDMDESTEDVWVAPKIYIGNYDELDSYFQERLHSLLEGGSDIEGFIQVMEELDLGWDKNWPTNVSSVYRVPEIERESSSDPEVMVDYE